MLYPLRERLVTDFARWVASCAVPAFSPEEIYVALDSVDFMPLFQSSLGSIGAEEFRAWHEAAIAEMQDAQPKFNVGWAAKILNEYLKTKCYVGGYGRDGLVDVIHPPIDNGLMIGLRNKFSGDSDLRQQLGSLEKMSGLDSYAKYDELIQVCGRVARVSGCSLLESEQFWA
jgi:hypothetical protein